MSGTNTATVSSSSTAAWDHALAKRGAHPPLVSRTTGSQGNPTRPYIVTSRTSIATGTNDNTPRPTFVPTPSNARHGDASFDPGDIVWPNADWGGTVKRPASGHDQRELVAARRAEMWGAGFRPVAVYNPDATETKSGKAPRGFNWTDRARQNPPADAVGEVESVALNTGILCDGLRAIDIDIDNPTVAAAVKRLILARWPNAPMRFREGSSRVLFLLRAAEGSPPNESPLVGKALGRQTPKVEVLGHGHQFVADGYHSSGARLQWDSQPPWLTHRDQLPVASQSDIDAILDVIAPVIGAERKQRLNTGSLPSSSTLGLQAADPFALFAVLRDIPNDKGPNWQFWNRVGMAIYAAANGSDVGLLAWHAWSQKNPAYDARATNERYDSYRKSPPTEIGFGSLMHLAREARIAAGAIAPPVTSEDAYGALPPPEVASSDDGERQTAPVAGTFNAAVRPGRLPLVWARDMQPRLFAGGTLVKGLLDNAAMSVVYAPSNVGKSLFCLDLAFHIAMGRPWCGRKVHQGAVVYVAAEGGVGFHNRVAALKRHYEIGDEVDIPLAVIACPIDLRDPKADLPELLERLQEAAAKTGEPCVLLIVDTLSRAIAGGDENGAPDMTGFVANVDAIRQAGPHVMVIHHSGKDVGKGARGHSSLRAATDTEIELVRNGDGSQGTEAYVRKQRDMAGNDAFRFTLESVALGRDEDGEPVTSAVVVPDETPDAAHTSRRAKLTIAETAAFKCLADLVVREGMPMVGGHVPDGVQGVSADRWRGECEIRRAFKAELPKSRATAFRRAWGSLEKKGRVAARGDMVWLVRAADECPF